MGRLFQPGGASVSLAVKWHSLCPPPWVGVMIQRGESALLTASTRQIMCWEKDGAKGDQRFTALKYAFWEFDFKLVIKKQKTQKEPLTLFLSLPRRFREKNLLQKGSLRMFALA